MPTERLIRIAIACCLGLLFAAVVAWWTIQQDQKRAALPVPAVVPGVTVGGPFALVDHTGAPVTSDTYAGKYRLMFFGFTYCPDICPTELQVMATALDRLPADTLAKVQPLFVSIDPGRDTPAAMAEYVAQFHPAIVGLTGTAEQVDATAKAFRVYAARAPGGDAESYLMDHSTYTYLMGPSGEFLTVFPRGTGAEEMAAAVAKFVAAGT